MKNWKRFNMRESKTATLYKPKPKLLQYRTSQSLAFFIAKNHRIALPISRTKLNKKGDTS